MNVVTVNEVNAAYIAGFFDGEGCVSVGKSRSKSGNPFYWLSVSILNTDLRPLRLVQRFAGAGSIRPRHDKRANRRTCYAWQLTSDEAYNFLRKIHPYLQNKKPEVDLAFQFQLLKRRHDVGNRPLSCSALARCESYYRRIRALKKPVGNRNHIEDLDDPDRADENQLQIWSA